MELIGKYAGAEWTEQNKFFQTLPNVSNLAFSNCSKNMQKVIQMALQLLGCSEKVGKFAQRPWASPTGPHSGNLFSCPLSSQPTTFKIVITGFLNKQMLQQSITITAIPCLTIIARIFINGCNKLTAIEYWLFFEK